MTKEIKYNDEEGNTLYGFSVKDMSEYNRWLKVLAISFSVFVIFMVMSALWLKFSGVGHNIIYELSPTKSTGRYYHDMDYSKDKYIDYWNDMWAECEFGEKNYEAIRKEYSIT